MQEVTPTAPAMVVTTAMITFRISFQTDLFIMFMVLMV